MSDISLTLVLRLKTSKIINGVAKVQIKSEKVTPFGGIFHVREFFSIIWLTLRLPAGTAGWQRQEINGIEYELNSIITEKWEGKAIV